MVEVSKYFALSLLVIQSLEVLAYSSLVNKHLCQESCTVKVIINARAFIRIITFHGEGDGRLLEARVLTNNT